MEECERYGALADAVFDWIEKPGPAAVTSTITLTELLVKPYQIADDTLQRTYHALLTNYPNLSWIPPDLASLISPRSSAPGIECGPPTHCRQQLRFMPQLQDSSQTIRSSKE